MELPGKTAVVTGAGGGIGSAVARKLASLECRVACWDVRQEPLEEVVGEIEGEGRSAIAQIVDITSGEQVKAAISATREAFGDPDILVNAAGLFSASGPLWEADPDSWWNDVTVNLRGTMLCTWSVLPAMMARNSGVVVNFSGGGAGDPLPGATSYGSSKAAVLRFTDTLAGELRQEGIDVLVLALDPGFNRTGMTLQLAQQQRDRKWLQGVSKAVEQHEEHCMPEDAAGTVAQLLTHACPEFGGRMFHAKQDIAGLAANHEALISDDGLTLRFRGMR